MKGIPKNSKVLERMARDRKVRKSVTTKSFRWFFAVYFPHYLKYETAPFQLEMMHLLESSPEKLLAFMAFRGSGKSTIVTLAYVLWAILGSPGKKFVLLVSQTQRQARQLLRNVKQELEDNPLLRGDLGPFEEEKDEWGSVSLVISGLGAKITAASTEQSVRGMRHGAHRPDLVVCDDLEDLASARTEEGREKLRRWFIGEILPAGDRTTRIIAVGNMLHEDCFMARLRKSIGSGWRKGVFREYPLIDENGACLWPGKFPDQASIEEEEKKIGNRNAWMREYMLAIVPEENQIVLAEWIRYADSPPKESAAKFLYAVLAVDPAISMKQAGDCTAIVSARVYGYGKNLRIHILPNPVNTRIHFPQQSKTIREVSDALGEGAPAKILVESVAYQEALIQDLKDKKYPVEGISPAGMDKRSRLAAVTPLLEQGKVFFPKKGAETLIRQLLGFGSERHDDLVDALTMFLGYCAKKDKEYCAFKEFLRVNQEMTGGADDDDEKYVDGKLYLGGWRF